jgi:hypothetical protein
VRVYISSGHAYLVCPRLLEQDRRHGEHPSTWPPCRQLSHVDEHGKAHGRRCALDHQHEEPLRDPEGHTVNDFYWSPGCRPPSMEEHPRCQLCNAPLVLSDLEDLYDQAQLDDRA